MDIHSGSDDIEIDGDEQEDEASGELLFDVFSAEAGFPFEKINPNMFGLEGVSRPSSTAHPQQLVDTDRD